MSSSTDIPLGTVEKFQKFPRSELDLEPLQLEADLEASLSNSSNIWSQVWKFAWRGVSVSLILFLLGYGLIQFGSMKSGSASNYSTTTNSPMPVWNTEISSFSPETIISWQETTSILSETTTMAPTTLTVLKMDPTTPFNHIDTVTLSELAKAKNWCPWGMSNERCNRFHDQFTATIEPPAPQKTFSAEFCLRQLGNQIYLEVNWLCNYCHRRATVWNKEEWQSESFPITCSANCYDNKHRRACAKRAFEWNQKTGEFGSPFNCKHC